MTTKDVQPNPVSADTGQEDYNQGGKDAVQERRSTHKISEGDKT